ncbi:hypothetical protein GCM10028806_18750 [Spirosoma terrae]|uniref:Uncharacterized protein n=1 Tax=Spirosoma terrae TaxID=1968276 RepID=A0A6L9L2R1_9BACT|nr:hypothetical protein [Spirosoma terrae]NDU94806.1 hypothetical protein [Spirosoma terrae]
MKTKWLFPHSFRLLGGLIFIPSLVLGLATLYADFEWKFLTTSLIQTDFPGQRVNQNLTNEVAGLGIIIGLMMIAFSREKVEDEMIRQLRLEALQWSVYANYLILAVAMLTVFDGAFFMVMIYNMFTVLLVFIARFRWLIYRNNQHVLFL